MTGPAGIAAQPRTGRGLHPLRERDFRLLWAGFATSTLADQMSLVTMAWLALQVTGSPLGVGGVLTAAAMPRAALTLLGGAVTDRVGARRLGIVTGAARVAVMGVLGGMVLTGTLRIGELYCLALLFGIVDAFFAPTRTTLIPQSVAPDQLEAANAVTATTSSLTTLLGPALGGLLVARAGTGAALAADAFLFLCVTVTTFGMRGAARRNPVAGSTQSIWRDIASGLAVVHRDPVLRTLVILVAAMSFAAAGPVEVGLAAMARSRFGGSAALGVLLGSFGAGMLVGSLAAGALPTRRLAPRLAGAGLVFAALMPLLGLTTQLPIAVGLIVLMGAASGQVNVIATSWLMRRTDPAYMGRLMSLLILTSVGISPVSLALAGVVAQFSVPLLFTASGAVMLLASIACVTNRDMRDS